LASWSKAGAVHKSRHVARALRRWLSIVRAEVRAAAHGARLAPGSLRLSEEQSHVDPAFLLTQAQAHGPVFKAWLDGKLTICIFGLDRGRRFLAENEHKLKAATTDLTPLFPFGSLRQMTGEPHLEYRRTFIEAFKAMSLREHETAIYEIIDRLLDDLAAADQPVAFAHIRPLIKRSLTEILFRLILGIGRGGRNFGALMDGYDRFAPNGIFVVVRPQHRAEYERLRSLLVAREADTGNGSEPRSLLSTLTAANKFDETALGNLIQMTEAGRFDMMGLWAWLITLLAGHEDILERIAAAPNSEAREAVCRAVVLEALRLEQSEFIFRVATRDIRFDGHFIPKRSRIRLAVWESHKDPANFENPFRFDPKRFLGQAPSADAYSPFGLDKHRCLGAEWVVVLSAMFVDRLAAGLRWHGLGYALPERGVFHFEPSGRLSVSFRRWTAGKG
jgi:cytochrome P450